VSATLLQRVEDALAKAGIASRSDLVVSLLEKWTSDRGC
jgi:metal-responsive CopG/Arc/MetJ family transcriptional regulator